MNQPKYQLKTHRLLSDAESLYLVKRWQQHKCKKSRDLLIECNQKFVYAVASVYRRKYSHVHLCDLVCYGNMGFIKGIERFDPNMGFSLRTFCVRWIIQSIQKEVNENESLIRLPANIHAQIAKNANKKNITDEDQILIDNYQGRNSIDAEINEDGFSIGDICSFKNFDYSTSAPELMHTNSIESSLNEAINSLPIDEQDMIRSIYGLDTKKHSVKKYARVNRLKYTAVSASHKKTLNDLFHILKDNHLDKDEVL